MAQIFNDEEDTVSYGPPLMNVIAEGMTKAVSRALNKEAVDRITQQVKLPENCKEIGVTKVNPEIWNSLPNFARMNDLNYQKTQQTISHGLITLANVAQILAKSKDASPSITEAMTCLKNGSNLLGIGFQDLNARRRAAMKPHLTPEYSGICSMKSIKSELLFGDNLEEELKKSKATSDLTRKVTNKTRPHYRKPYARSSQSNPLNFNRPSPNYQSRGGGQNRGQNQRRWRGSRGQ